MTKKVKWGIVGLGGIAHDFASVFHSDKAELVGVASRSLQKSQNFAEKYAIPKAYGSYEALCFDPDIDIIYLATPNSFHAEHMKMILKANKHVLCEKAITMNKKELDDVLALASEKELIVAEAMTIFHMPLFKEIKKRIDSGQFGKLKMVNAMFGSLKPADPTNRFFNKELGGGALLDIGVYALSFVQFFLDSQPESIHTTAQLYETGVDEMSAIHYKTKEGTIGNVTMNFRGKMPKQGVIVCEDAYITVIDYPRADTAIVTYPDGQELVIEAGDTTKGLLYEIENLSETVLGEANKQEIEKTIAVNEIMDQCAEDWGMDLTTV